MFNMRDVVMRRIGCRSNGRPPSPKLANRVRDQLTASNESEFSTSSREKRRRRGTISLSASQDCAHAGKEPRYWEKKALFLIRNIIIYINSSNQQWPTQLLTRPQLQRLPPRYVSFKVFFLCRVKKITLTFKSLFYLCISRLITSNMERCPLHLMLFHVS